ncbi:low-density lipoprotein receptor class A domain-containing protein 2 isoform X2 [Synchiropus splendidus]|uniref:low-density lipoprotein receptor class A domain-containing protein 2 isoform X2 n=1 Tax=Synchiropus splendidus TaxID=270530 RepID=UPI00237EBCD4|nr:low-density lipoprotein receptor class A domain-containing protein 2 isoform X2 [Synchiropus splendidus]
MARGPRCLSLRLILLLSCVRVHSTAMETVNMVDFCGQTIRGDGMIVNSHQESKKFYFVSTGTDCHLTMQARSPLDKVQFYFRFFLVYSLLRVAPLSPAPVFQGSLHGSASLKPGLGSVSGRDLRDPCHSGSYVQFYDGPDKSSPALGHALCGKSPPRLVLSTGNYLTLRLVTRGTQPRVDFVGDFTSFRLGFNHSECTREPYFTCGNGKCIPLSLVCDDKGIDNCGDGSDLEENLSSGCQGHHLLPERLLATPSPAAVSVPSAERTATRSYCRVPASAPSEQSLSDPRASWTLLLVSVGLAVAAGALVLYWCCWSPGWLLWRLSVCRFSPWCNLLCSSCQLCSHSSEHRPAKVSPQPPVAMEAADNHVSSHPL